MTNKPSKLQKYHLAENPSLQAAVEDLVSDALAENPSAQLLGQGSAWRAYELELEGEKYAVKISNGQTHSSAATSQSAERILAGQHVEALEHLVAFDADRGVIVSSLVPGKRLIDLSQEELSAIPDAHFKEALYHLVIATKDNIIFDPKPTNFLYDPKTGFGYVDVNVSELDSQYSADFLYRVEAAVSGFAVALQNVGTYGKAPTSTDEKELAISSIESGIKASARLTEIAGTMPDIVPPTSLLGIYSSTSINADSKARQAATYKADIGLGPQPEAPGWTQGLD